MKGPAVMVGQLHGGLRYSQEMVPGLGFSRVLMRVRTPGHCERDSTHLLGGKSNIFPREVLILFAIVLGISLSRKMLCSYKRGPVVASPESLCVLAPITQDARTIDVLNASRAAGTKSSQALTRGPGLSELPVFGYLEQINCSTNQSAQKWRVGNLCVCVCVGLGEHWGRFRCCVKLIIKPARQRIASVSNDICIDPGQRRSWNQGLFVTDSPLSVALPLATIRSLGSHGQGHILSST